MSKPKMNLYYFCLIAVTLSMCAYTVWVGAQSVAYGKKIAQLEKQRQQTISQAQDLQKNIQQETAIAAIAQTAAQENFVKIASAVQVQASTHSDTRVALR
jgi:hypothetical protein